MANKKYYYNIVRENEFERQIAKIKNSYTPFQPDLFLDPPPPPKTIKLKKKKSESTPSNFGVLSYKLDIIIDLLGTLIQQNQK